MTLKKRLEINRWLQKWLVITLACFHLFVLLMPRSVTTCIRRLLLARPIKKWFGVSASSSCKSLLTCIIGRLFNSDSTSVRKVSRVSSVASCLAATAFRDFFADWTRRSQAPPKWGDAGGLKCHCIPSWQSWSSICDRFQLLLASQISSFALTKLAPRSDHRCAGSPRLATILRIAMMHESASRGYATSK